MFVLCRQNKFAIAQSGAIQPLVAMLYSDVREAQASNGGGGLF